VVPASLTLVFALQVLVVVLQGLLGEDLGPPERTRPGRKLQTLAVPESWRSGLASGGRAPLIVFVDGGRLKPRDVLDAELRDTALPATPEGVVPSHFREDGSGQLIISCPDALPCRMALVVANEPRLVLAALRERLWRSPLRVLGAAVMLAACAGVAFRVSRSATAAQVAVGCAFVLCGVALWLSGGRYAGPFAMVLVAGEAVAFSAPFLLQERLRRVRGFVQERLRRVPGFVADLLLFHDPVAAPRPAWWRIAKVCGLGGIGLLALISLDALAPPPWQTLTPDVHRNRSLEIALNRALCRAGSSVSDSVRVVALLDANPDLGQTPLRDVLAGAAGSLEAYCRSVVEPFVNNENSLMAEMALFAAARPQLSIRDLGWGLQASRILALMFVAYVLLECGASFLFAATVLVAGLKLLGAMWDRYYSVYPFLPILVALAVAAPSLALHRQLPSRSVAHGFAACALGCLIAFATNMRTSHLPLFVAFLSLYFLAAHRHLARKLPCWPIRSQAGWLAIGVASALIGYGVVDLLITSRFQKQPTDPRANWQLTYHVVSHSLVLGLANPENPLSIREGIQWNDAAGLALARRIDPQVGYLNKAYEAALFRYYVRLWTQYPAEMGKIYLVKLRLAGKDMLLRLWDDPDSLPGARFFRAMTLPLSWVPDGLTLLLLYAAAFGISTVAHLRRGSSVAFALSLFCVAALLLQVECAIIIPDFVVSHQASQLLCMLVLSAFVWQLALEGIGAAVRSAWK
jgi:hypothetical protein